MRRVTLKQTLYITIIKAYCVCIIFYVNKILRWSEIKTRGAPDIINYDILTLCCLYLSCLTWFPPVAYYIVIKSSTMSSPCQPTDTSLISHRIVWNRNTGMGIRAYNILCIGNYCTNTRIRFNE